MVRTCSHNCRVFGTSNVQKKAAVCMLIDTGDQSTMSGSGEVFEKFQRTGVIDGYTGQGRPVTKFTDPNCDVDLLQMMDFDDTFQGLNYDVTRSNFQYFYFITNRNCVLLVCAFYASKFYISDICYDKDKDQVGKKRSEVPGASLLNIHVQ